MNVGRKLRSLPGRRWTAIAFLCVLTVGALPAAGAESASGKLYRYWNEQGAVEIGDAVPPEHVARGYEVLDAATGQVLETVAAELSPEELGAKQARDREADACRQNLARVEALYGTVKDVDAAAEQAHRALETRIGHLETSRTLELRRLEEQERDAAQRERTGRIVTPVMHEDMERSRARIGATEAEIAQRRQEQVQSKAQFEADRELFERGTCEAAPGPRDQ